MSLDTRLSTTFEIKLEGATQTVSALNSIDASVAKVSQEIEAFQKRGSIGAIAVGREAIDDARKRVQYLNADIQRTQFELVEARTKFAGIGDVASKEFYTAQQRVAALERQLATTRKELVRLPVDMREEVGRAVGYLGDLDTGLQTFATATGTVGRFVGGGAGAAIQKAGYAVSLSGDAFAIAEQIPRINNAFSIMGQRLRELDAANKAAAATAAFLAQQEAALNLARELGSADAEAELLAQAALEGQKAAANANVASSLWGVVKAAGPTALALAAVGAGVYLLSQESKEATKKVERFTRSLLDIDVSKVNEFQLSVKGTTDSINEQILQTQVQIISLEQNRAALQGKIGQLEAQYDIGETSLRSAAYKYTRLWEQITGTKFIESLGQYKDQLDNNAAALDTARENLIYLNNALGSTSILVSNIIDNVDSSIQRLVAGYELERTAIEGNADQLRKDQQSKLYEISAISTQIIEIEQALNGQLGELSELDRIRLENAKTDLMQRRQLVGDELRAIEDWLPYAEQRAEQLKREAEAQERVANVATQATDAVTGFNDALADYRSIAEQIAELEQERTETLERQAVLAERTRIEEDLLAQIANAKALEKEQEYQDKVIAINEETYQKRLKLEVDLRNALADIAGKRAKIESEYQRDYTKTMQEYEDERLKLLRDYEKEKRRIQQEFDRAALDAQRDNDVNAFIAAKEARDQDLSALDEQTKERETALQQQLADELEALQIRRDEALAALQDEINERRATYRLTLEELRKSNQEQLDELADTQAEVVTRSEELEQQLADLREQWREEDNNRQLAQEEQTYNERLRLLQENQNRALTEMQNYYQVARNLSRGFGDELGAVLSGLYTMSIQLHGAMSSTGYGPPTYSAGPMPIAVPGGHGGYQPSPIVLNATGGVYDRPTLIKVGEDRLRGDVVIPYVKSEGIDRALARMGAARGSQYNIPVTVNADLSTSQANRLIAGIQHAILEVFDQVLETDG